MEQIAGKVPSLVPESYRPIIKWNADRLDAEQCRLLETWPLTFGLDIPPLGHVLFCHATPQNENDIFTRITAEARLRPIFDAADARVVVCGHTHMPFDRLVGKTRVVNAAAWGAFWRTARLLRSGRTGELRHCPTISTRADRVRRSSYPAARICGRSTSWTPVRGEMISWTWRRADVRMSPRAFSARVSLGLVAAISEGAWTRHGKGPRYGTNSQDSRQTFQAAR